MSMARRNPAVQLFKQSREQWRLHLMYSYVPRWFRPSYRGTFKKDKMCDEGVFVLAGSMREGGRDDVAKV